MSTQEITVTEFDRSELVESARARSRFATHFSTGLVPVTIIRGRERAVGETTTEYHIGIVDIIAGAVRGSGRPRDVSVVLERGVAIGRAHADEHIDGISSPWYYQVHTTSDVVQNPASKMTLRRYGLTVNQHDALAVLSSKKAEKLSRERSTRDITTYIHAINDQLGTVLVASAQIEVTALPGDTLVFANGYNGLADDPESEFFTHEFWSVDSSTGLDVLCSREIGASRVELDS